MNLARRCGERVKVRERLPGDERPGGARAWGNAWCPADPMHLFLMMKDLRKAIGGG